MTFNTNQSQAVPIQRVLVTDTIFDLWLYQSETLVQKPLNNRNLVYHLQYLKQCKDLYQLRTEVSVYRNFQVPRKHILSHYS